MKKASFAQPFTVDDSEPKVLYFFSPAAPVAWPCSLISTFSSNE
jgi:hypothetical protein